MSLPLIDHDNAAAVETPVADSESDFGAIMTVPTPCGCLVAEMQATTGAGLLDSRNPSLSPSPMPVELETPSAEIVQPVPVEEIVALPPMEQIHPQPAVPAMSASPEQVPRVDSRARRGRGAYRPRAPIRRPSAGPKKPPSKPKPEPKSK